MRMLTVLTLLAMFSQGCGSKAYFEVDLTTVLSVNKVTTVGHVFGLGCLVLTISSYIEKCLV